jgi:hypothetical protein
MPGVSAAMVLSTHGDPGVADGVLRLRPLEGFWSASGLEVDPGADG